MTVKNIPTVEESLAEMESLYNESYSNLTEQEKKQSKELGHLVKKHNENKFVMRLLDETYQIRDTQKIARRVRKLLYKYGIPKSLPFIDQAFFLAFIMIGHLPPFCYLMIPTLRLALRKATKVLVLDADSSSMRKNRQEKVSLGLESEVCFMGEKTLGFREANRLFEQSKNALKSPYVERLAVKLTSIYPNTIATNYDEGKAELEKRLTELYRTAMQNKWTSPSGTLRYKVVMIDTEEYKDVRTTIDVFKRVLSQPEFKSYTAGITLQAYLIDAWDIQTELLDFAKKRQEDGGAPLEMRLVKGRFHATENIISELRGWKSPVLQTKVEVDANYMHLLDRAMMLENAKALHVGIATHNPYTISYACLLGKKLGTPKRCYRLELLEGIANHLLRTLSPKDVQVLVHEPMVANEEYGRAVAYIVRRFNDMFNEETFISKSFTLRPNTAVWDRLAEHFKKAYAMKDKMVSEAVHHQDRNEYYGDILPMDTFVNEADTDFSQKNNQLWAKKIVKKWKTDGTMTGNRCDWRKWQPGDTLPSQIGDTLVYNERRHKYYDRSQDGKVEICEMSITDPAQMERALLAAATDKSGWRQTDMTKRREILYKVANNIGMMRAELVGALCAISGAIIEAADGEVSEAMNYCRLYTHYYKELSELEGVELAAKGVVLVLTPWMYTASISCSSISAALIAGNSCIVKASTHTAPVVWLIANAFWNAGVPKDALQVGITDSSYYSLLASSPFVNHICLNGHSSTAEKIAHINTGKSLHAETGAKNAVILTAKGDMYSAIANVCLDAFSYAGQSCTACSLFLVERSVYNNPVFRNVLKDCAESMKTGSVWNIGNAYGPLISNKSAMLKKAMQLELGEKWLVKPEFADDEGYFMKPAIKIDVQPGSFTFNTELDAPLLAVAPFDKLKDAIKMVNDHAYGLCTGLFSLDENEQKQWRSSVIAGSLFINRNLSILKAYIQPIGGLKNSAYGAKFKAGGPNFCFQMFHAKNKAGAEIDYKKSYAEWYEKEFKPVHNLSPHMTGELNLLHYMPLKKGMVLRLIGDEPQEDIDMVMLAASTVGTKFTVSADPNNEAVKHLHGHVVKESLSDFYDHLIDFRRIRTISPNVPDSLFARASALNLNVITGKPVRNGRIELAYYVYEQSLSYEYSRYGLEIDTPDN